MAIAYELTGETKYLEYGKNTFRMMVQGSLGMGFGAQKRIAENIATTGQWESVISYEFDSGNQTAYHLLIGLNYVLEAEFKNFILMRLYLFGEYNGPRHRGDDCGGNSQFSKKKNLKM